MDNAAKTARHDESVQILRQLADPAQPFEQVMWFRTRYEELTGHRLSGAGIKALRDGHYDEVGR